MDNFEVSDNLDTPAAKLMPYDTGIWLTKVNLRVVVTCVFVKYISRLT